ncbi:TetR/AcrR family transcriptional regulator [Nocardioides dubius]|uniref:TetR/AcrR family transcriptional regulator n=1 Tax=Nocardioides dubius TaxID=317019 RepID=A0ABN1TLZ4_9ACTN
MSRLDRRGPGRGDERRAALLLALDELLREAPSLESINVAEVSRRAGVTRSAFYFYFESKAMAVMALLEEMYDDAANETDRLVEAEGEPEPRIHQVISHLFDMVDRRPYAYRVLLEARATSATLREDWDQGRAGFAQQIATMITNERATAKAPDGADADALASVLLELNDRSIERYALGHGPARAAHIDALTSIWVRTIYGGQR